MNITRNRIASAIASILACSLLAACGGGGGGMVRNNPLPASPPPTPPPPPPPPPPARSLQLPAPPTPRTPASVPALDNTSDPAFTQKLDHYRTTLGDGFSYDAATGNYLVTSIAEGPNATLEIHTPGSLVKRGTGNLALWDSRIDNGVRVDAGTLEVWGNLHADVVIQPEATLDFMLWADVSGDISNHGVLDATELGGGWYDDYYDGDIFGDYTQSADGTLRALLGIQTTALATPLLTVAGKAVLDGKLELRPSGYIPSGGYLEWILHAHGGVFGQFAHWTSPGLFLEGSLRYGSHDVWFELTRVSLQAAASANNFGSPLTLASAGNIDRALAAADGFARNPTPAQQRLLASAGRLLWMNDPTQAQRALDSLSGLPQVQALDAAMHEAGMSPALSAHLDRRAHTHAAGAWSQAGVTGTQTGVDQWLGPHLLAGVHVARDNAQAHAGLQASMQGDARGTGAYLRWFGNDGWYAGADASYAQRTTLLDRPIDFGSVGQWNAHSRRTLDVASLGGEAGRRLSFAGGSVTPFLRLDASAVRGAETVEQGDSGFELALDQVTQRRLAASSGLRYTRDWRFADGGWLQLQVGCGVQQTLWQGGGTQRAAFTGAPGVWFDLPGVSQRRSSWLDLGLHGGFGHDWRWAMQGMHNNGNKAWQLRLARDF